MNNTTETATERAARLNKSFVIPAPLSRPLNLYYTRQDAEQAFKAIVAAYEQLGVPAAELNWKTIRNMSGDSIATVIDAAKRQGTK